MFKKLKNARKMFTKGGNGFTLVELMIVIAVIALLILVLIPRVGIIKNKAREAGIKTNMLMVEGIVQSIINDYQVKPGQAATIEAQIAANISNVTISTQQMRNPFTGGTTVETALADIDIDSVAAYDSGDDDLDTEASIDTLWVANIAKSEGIIAFAAFQDSVGATPPKMAVKLIPYGQGGNRLDVLRKVIHQ